MHRVDLVVMNGRSTGSDVERMVDDVRAAITCDLVDRALDSGAFDCIIVSTNDPRLAEKLAGLPWARDKQVGCFGLNAYDR